MDGWMPRLSPDGCHVGSGFGEWWLDDRAMGPGWHPVWWDGNRVLVYRDDLKAIWAYILDADEYVEIATPADVNTLAAGGGRWAWYSAASGRITRDDGSTIQGREPAVWADHLAYVIEQAPDVQTLMLDGQLVRTARILTDTTPGRIRTSAAGLAWLEWHEDGWEAWGLRWGGEPERVQPTWRECFFAVPILGPHGIPWLLAGDEARLMLVPWGAHVGYLVAEGEDLLHPDGAWTSEQWRVAWCDPQGHRFEATAYPDAPQTDFMANAPTPPPPPEIAFALDATSGTAPCTIVASITRKIEILTHRWLAGLATAEALAVDPTPEGQPVDGDEHAYRFEEPGVYAVALRARPRRGDVFTTPRQLVTITAPPPPKHLAGVQTGFGNPIVGTRNVYRELRAMEWRLMRLETYRAGPRVVNDFEYATDPALTRVILDEVRDADCEPIVIAGATHILGLPCWPRLKVELYNEADLAMTAAAYVQKVRPVLDLCYERGYDVYTSGISNPSPEGLAWLRAVLQCLPAWVNCCYHRYPQNAWDVAGVPRKPYRSRGEEFAALWAAVQTGMPAGQKRRVICSEFGYNQAWFEQGWWIFKRKRRLADQEVLDRVRPELAYQREAGISASIYYQIDEDPSDLKNVFGLRRRVSSTLVWKPVARVNLV